MDETIKSRFLKNMGLSQRRIETQATMLRARDELPLKGLWAKNQMKKLCGSQESGRWGSVTLDVLWVLYSAGKESLDCEPWGWDPRGFWYTAWTSGIQWVTVKENIQLSKHALGECNRKSLCLPFLKICLLQASLILLCFTDVRFFTNGRQDLPPAKGLWLALLPWWSGTKPAISPRFACIRKTSQVIGVVKSEHPKGSHVLPVTSLNSHLSESCV